MLASVKNLTRTDRYIQQQCYVIGVHLDFHKADAWRKIFIGAAIEVHRLKGPGLLEPIYHKCVRRECELRNITAQYEWLVPIEYKGFVFEEPLRLDLLIDDCLIVELNPNS
jgi:GxxExxY protein